MRRPRGQRELAIVARTAIAVALFIASTVPTALTQVAGFDPRVVLAAADGDPVITGAIPTPAGNFVNRSLKGDRTVVPGPATAGTVGPQVALFAGTLAAASSFAPRATEVAQRVAMGPMPWYVEPVAIDPEAAIDGMMVAAINPDAPIGYANDAGTEDFEAPFRALMMMPTARPQIDMPRPDPVADHDWVANPYPDSARTAPELRCLAEAIYFESRSEPWEGQLAVAQVVMNRVKNPAYPDTICNVVYQNRTWYNACQFSFACDGIRDVVRDYAQWEIAQELARSVVYGEAEWLEEIGSATHYHAVYVRPNWAPQMRRMTQIGLHIFYRTYGGGWI
ncbi:MAG: cell wall hydrolase [Bauldia sp.]|nr:cell wall hydrolase [Bauldia sp.]